MSSSNPNFPWKSFFKFGSPVTPLELFRFNNDIGFRRNLADTQSRGALDSTDFAIGMYLIQASMSGQLSFIPTTLPPALYEQAGGNPQVNIPPHATGTSGSFSPTLTGAFPQARSALQQQYTGQVHSLQPNYTGTSPGTSPRQPTRPAPSSFGSGAFATPQGNGHARWDVTAAEKTSADHLFDGLDSQKKGYIEGDVAVPFMLESKLLGDDLAQIWYVLRLRVFARTYRCFTGI